MNKLLRILAEQTFYTGQWEGDGVYTGQLDLEKFAQLIVEECRTVVNDLYHKTPLELCGPLLTADEEIAKHFYGEQE